MSNQTTSVIFVPILFTLLILASSAVRSEAATTGPTALSQRSKTQALEVKVKALNAITKAEAAIASAQRALDAAIRENKPAIVTKAQTLIEQNRKKKAEAETLLKEVEFQLKVLQEQDEFESMNAAWLRKQHDLIKEAVEQDKRWRREVMDSIKEIRVPESEFRPRSMADLKVGDILLLSPKGEASSQLVAIVDQFYTGRVFKSGLERPVSHAITFLGRDASGRSLFLDNTTMDMSSARGTHIIGETEFEQRYGSRPKYVARPQATVDGRELFRVAVETAHKAKERVVDSDYGLLGNDAVCSERAAIAVAKATGLKLENHRLGPIDITPGDFFDQESVGKYFMVFPLEK